MSAAVDATGSDAGDPIRYATELELCRAHRETWTRMQWAMEANDTQAVGELAQRIDAIMATPLRCRRLMSRKDRARKGRSALWGPGAGSKKDP